MFSSYRRFSVNGADIVSSNRSKVEAKVGSGSAVPGRSTELADALPAFYTGNSGISNNVRMTSSGPLSFTFMMTGIVPENEDMLRRYYRDIYLYDTVCGSCVDIMSAFPFSEYTLTGGETKQLEKFEESLFRINIRSLMPEISVNHMVDGAFCGTLVFNYNEKVFTDVLLHDLDRCRIDPTPFYSADPKITVINDEMVKRFLSNDDAYSRALQQTFSPQFIAALKSDAYELNPITTLFVPRRTLTSKPYVSALKRALPIYLLEKQLYRGTLVEAHKRQRAMFHVTAGDDTWEPTPEELDALTSLFQQAELDPLGAIITTRNGVASQELRQGGDFWKWTDAADSLVSYKLRALGISEAFLSQDANFSNAETALSVFLENLDAYRTFLTYKVIYNKIFPVISYHNGFYQAGKESRKGSMGKALYLINNQSDLVIPKLVWHKKLAAKSDKDPFDVLEKLTEKDIPIPLRMWLAAGEVDYDSLVHELEEDKAIREAISKFSGTRVGYGDDNQGGIEEAKLKVLSTLLGKRKKKPLLSRDFGSMSEIKGKTKTGKDRVIFDQVAANQQANKVIAQTIKKFNDPNYRASIKARVAKKYNGQFPKMFGNKG